MPPDKMPGHNLAFDPGLPRIVRDTHENVHLLAHDCLGNKWCDTDTHFTFWSGFINALLWAGTYPRQAARVKQALDSQPGEWKWEAIDAFAGRMSELNWVRPKPSSNQVLERMQSMKAAYKAPEEGAVVSPVVGEDMKVAWQEVKRLGDGPFDYLPDWPDQ